VKIIALHVKLLIGLGAVTTLSVNSTGHLFQRKVKERVHSVLIQELVVPKSAIRVRQFSANALAQNELELLHFEGNYPNPK
jgi:hypothetical protein